MAAKRKSSAAGEQPAERGKQRAGSPQASRMGKVQIQAWVTEEMRRRLKILAAQTDRTQEELIVTALTEMLKKQRV
jgi:hypothetical protein